MDDALMAEVLVSALPEDWKLGVSAWLVRALPTLQLCGRSVIGSYPETGVWEAASRSRPPPCGIPDLLGRVFCIARGIAAMTLQAFKCWNLLLRAGFCATITWLFFVPICTADFEFVPLLQFEHIVESASCMFSIH
jgi:hypothetical protein